MMRLLLSLFCFILVTACSTLPKEIEQAPTPDIQLNDVSGNVKQYDGAEVRWGGLIVNVENKAEGAELQIAEFPLNHFGRPRLEQKSSGRFLVVSQDFIDPYIYKADTIVTITGVLSGEQLVKVDQKSIQLPVIKMKSLYRWQPYQAPYDPYYYGWPYYYDRFDYGVGYPGWRSYWRYDHRHYW